MRMAVMLLALVLAGCGGESDETIGKEIADDYNRAMDEAREVEEQLQEQQQAIEDALEEAERALPDP